jgi:hypothetical protein
MAFLYGRTGCLTAIFGVFWPGQLPVDLRDRGGRRARSQCHFAPPLIHFIPDSLFNIFGTSISESTMRPNRRRAATQGRSPPSGSRSAGSTATRASWRCGSPCTCRARRERGRWRSSAMRCVSTCFLCESLRVLLGFNRFSRPLYT